MLLKLISIDESSIVTGESYAAIGYISIEIDVIAKEYFEQAADNEEAGGLYNLGVMYLKGIGANRDTKIASKYFINAFDAGQPKTFYQLAKMFHNSVSLKKNVPLCVAASVALRHADTVWTCSAAVDNVPPRHASQSYIVHSSLVPTNRELKMLFFLTLRSVQTLSDPKVIDKIKIELFGAITITRKIILEGGGDGVIGGGSGATVDANDAPLTVFKIKHYEYDHTGYTDFTYPNKCSRCKCQNYKAKHDVVINAINVLTASVKELTSKRSVISSKRILDPSTPLEIKTKRRRKVIFKALSNIQKSKLVTPLSVFFIEQYTMAKGEQNELKKMDVEATVEQH
ncbi:ERAD-associated E3 ubiquitin-protein ligase component HRD3A [Capsicum chinense]|nr:ERAD-associated E3 ubiquitin-protein ligase component HRD3A [Capsicum chinense]